MDDSKEEIMEATYKALCRHGYADLTIEKIAEESNKGKSNIYYHFDDKKALILDFLDYMKDNLRNGFECLNGGDPEENFDKLLDMMLGVEDQEMWDFHRVLMEIQGRAQYDQEFEEKFRELDEIAVRKFTDVLKDLDVEDARWSAEFTVSTIQGALSQSMVREDREKLQQVKEKLKELV